MAILGMRDLKSVGLPSAWDAGELEKIRLRSGETFGDFMRDLGAALPLINQGLVGGDNALLGQLVAFQNDPTVEYPVGTPANGVRPSSEYADPIPFKGRVSGHMLPLHAWERALGWTRMGLAKARRSQLDADVRAAVTDIKLKWQIDLLQRFFQIEPEPVGTASNASPGFADGGLATSEYAPPPGARGQKFDSTHMHYLRYSSLDDATVQAAVAHLKEHGHRPPYTIIASEADRATWSGLSGWLKPTYDGIRPALTESRATAPDLTPYDGYYEADTLGIAQVWFSPLVPAGYFGVHKAYAPLDPRNSLRVRWDENIGVGWQLWPGQEFGKRAFAMFYTEYGVGVGEDRTNGVLVQIASSGSYTTPTIGE